MSEAGVGEGLLREAGLVRLSGARKTFGRLGRRWSSGRGEGLGARLHAAEDGRRVRVEALGRERLAQGRYERVEDVTG